MTICRQLVLRREKYKRDSFNGNLLRHHLDGDVFPSLPANGILHVDLFVFERAVELILRMSFVHFCDDLRM